ncbi:hypothetical protein FGO68_gene1492 [Halteria grandinella]|uniref:Uncharacterized protein n=1 Tax=Halteria grandinella TaxID=5974 RepID=A0A8J8NR63_HALGN|nr:hypothetical protein FGO68_gene1492 [Halteria grandinella]
MQSFSQPNFPPADKLFVGAKPLDTPLPTLFGPPSTSGFPLYPLQPMSKPQDPCTFMKQVVSLQLIPTDTKDDVKCEQEGTTSQMNCRVPNNIVANIALYLDSNTQFTKYTVLSKRSRVAMLQSWLRKERADSLRVFFSHASDFSTHSIGSLFKFAQGVTLVLATISKSLETNLRPQGDTTLLNMERFFAKSVSILDYELPYIRQDFHINLQIGDDQLSLLFLVLAADDSKVLPVIINRDYLRLDGLFDLIERSSKVQHLMLRNINQPCYKSFIAKIWSNSGIRPQEWTKYQAINERFQKTLRRCQGELSSIILKDCMISLSGMERIGFIFQGLTEIVLEECKYNREAMIEPQPKCAGFGNVHNIKIIEKASQYQIKEDKQSFSIISLPYLKKILPPNFASLHSVDLSLELPLEPSELECYMSPQASIFRDCHSEFNLSYLVKLAGFIGHLEQTRKKAYPTAVHIGKLVVMRPSSGLIYSSTDFKGLLESGLREHSQSIRLLSLGENAEEITMVFGVDKLESTLKVILHKNAENFHLKYV